jgi:hypothetical protein
MNISAEQAQSLAQLLGRHSGARIGLEKHRNGCLEVYVLGGGVGYAIELDGTILVADDENRQWVPEAVAA